MLPIEYIANTISLLENRLHRDYCKKDIIIYNKYLRENVDILNKYYPSIINYDKDTINDIVMSLKKISRVKGSRIKENKSISNDRLKEVYNFKSYIQVAINTNDISLANDIYDMAFQAIINAYKVLQ